MSATHQSPLTFVEIRLHAIVILLQYLLIMFVVFSTFFSGTAWNKVNIRGQQSALERNYVNIFFFHFAVKDLINFSIFSKGTGPT